MDFLLSFTLCFCAMLGKDFTDVINEWYDWGCLSNSYTRRVITMIPRTSARSRTLLCFDYKIAAKAIANHLLAVIASVISPSQTAGIPGRSSAANVCMLRDIIEFANDNDLSAAILSLDQEKAFDRVEWHFMSCVLVVNCVKLFYTYISSSIIVNGLFPHCLWFLTACASAAHFRLCCICPCLLASDPFISWSNPCYPWIKSVQVPGYLSKAASTYAHQDQLAYLPIFWGEKREWLARDSVTQHLGSGILGVLLLILYARFSLSTVYGSSVISFVLVTAGMPFRTLLVLYIFRQMDSSHTHGHAH